MLGCMYALLLAGALPKGQSTTSELSEQHGHAAPPKPAFAAPAPPDAGAAMELNFPDSVPSGICQASFQGKVVEVVEWLKKGGSVEAICPTETEDGIGLNVTLLRAAAQGNRPMMVKALLARGANVNRQDNSEGTTALMVAANRGHLTTTNVLLKQPGINLDLTTSGFLNGGMTALMLAAQEGCNVCVQRLLQAKANPELRSDVGATAYQYADHKGHTLTAQLIWRYWKPAFPGAGEPAMNSSAPLPHGIMSAAQQGNVEEVVEWLTTADNPPLIRLVDAVCPFVSTSDDLRYTTLLSAAAGKGKVEMVKELMKRGANVNWKDTQGATALMIAAKEGHRSVTVVLLKHSAINFDVQSNDGSTALIYAAQDGQEGCVTLLLRAGANTELRDKFGLTALQHAERRHHKATVDLIQQHTAPPQPAFPSLADSPDADEPAVSSPEIKAEAAEAARLAAEAEAEAKAEVEAKAEAEAEAEAAEVARLTAEVEAAEAEKTRLKVEDYWRWKTGQAGQAGQGGVVDALCSSIRDGPTVATLVDIADAYDQLGMVNELLKQGPMLVCCGVCRVWPDSELPPASL